MELKDIIKNNVTENTVLTETTSTVYNDFRLTVSNSIFTAAGLNNEERIFVYVSNNQNAIYLTNKNSLDNEFAISKILKHTPNKGIRLNIGKVLNIGEIPCEVNLLVLNGMVKIYPKDGINRLPALKAYLTICNTILQVYGYTIYLFLDRIEKDVI